MDKKKLNKKLEQLADFNPKKPLSKSTRTLYALFYQMERRADELAGNYKSLRTGIEDIITQEDRDLNDKDLAEFRQYVRENDGLLKDMADNRKLLKRQVKG